MRTVMVQYKTSPAQADANEALIRAVFAELHASTPQGLRYATYRLPDGVTFLHIATVQTTDANPLTALPSFKAFQAQLKERCVEAPVVTELNAIASYSSATLS